MSTARTTLRLTLVTSAVVTVAAACVTPAHAATTSTAPAARQVAATDVTRLAGADRYGTAAAISRHQFPNGARSVYLVNAAASADAISAGMVDDGPILLVPGSGAVPASTTAEISRLAPTRVVAVGGTAVVPDAALRTAANGRTTVRWAGSDRYATAAAVARAVYRPVTPSGDHATYFVGAFATPDAVVAGSLATPSEPVFPLPPTGPAPAVIRSAAADTNGGFGLAIGGPSAVSEATFVSAASGMVRGRTYGASRYDTAVKVADNGRPAPTTVYLAGGSGPQFADALAAGTLTRGPVILAPKDGTLPMSVATYLAKIRPAHVIVLGGAGAVSDLVVRQAQNAADGRMPTQDVHLPNPYVAKDVLRAGWTVSKTAATTGELTCDGASVAGRVAGTYQCGATYQSAYACYAKPGYSNVVTCITDPWTKKLLEYRVSAPLPRTAATDAADALPVAMDLGGTHCLLRSGGAWGSRGNDIPWAGCLTENPSTALWSDLNAAHPDQRVDGATRQYRFGPWDTSVPLVWKDVTTRFYLG